MTSGGTVLEGLIGALRNAARFNPNDAAPPAAVLWTDKSGAFRPLIPTLRERLPVLTLGPYQPQEWTGPVIWLRCALAGTLSELSLPEGTPVLYLPGVSRQDLRAVESCPKDLQPLLELQYRGVFFSQKNARDWTPAAFLQGGLNIKVREDPATRDALGRALPRVMDETVQGLSSRAPLDATFFNGLLNPDPARQLLAWLNDPDGEKARLDSEGGGRWAAFGEVCKKTYGFDPSADGAVSAAEKLGEQGGAWQTIWARFKEAPQRYPQLPDVLRRAGRGKSDLFSKVEAWPQDNEDEENRLQQELSMLKDKPPAEARAALQELEAEHGKRRDWVWSALQRAPLAGALKPLTQLLVFTDTPMGAGTPEEIAARYADVGWRADGAALEALAAVSSPAHVNAVSAALLALYRPWVEAGATSFQKAVRVHGLPKTSVDSDPVKGRCLLFTDGLRFDVAMKLKRVLEEQDLEASASWRFGAAPGVTASAKPAASPIAAEFEPGDEFSVRAKGVTVTAPVLRRELEQAGFTVLLGNNVVGNNVADVQGSAWTEYGNLDSLGHNEGWKLSHRIDQEVRSIAARIAALIEAGWSEVVVITDHGWLLLPGGFPTATLPQHLTEARKGRCARIKASATTEYQTVPWHFDQDVRIAVAPGICTFVAGKEYEHGGLTAQENVLPVLTVTAGNSTASMNIDITAITWKGFRCYADLRGAVSGIKLDLRNKAADASSSLLAGQQPKEVKGGKASLVVPDDSLEGLAVHLVVLDASGNVVAQRTTTVGV